jgi:hypothetical protein
MRGQSVREFFAEYYYKSFCRCCMIKSEKDLNFFFLSFLFLLDMKLHAHVCMYMYVYVHYIHLCPKSGSIPTPTFLLNMRRGRK